MHTKINNTRTAHQRKKAPDQTHNKQTMFLLCVLALFCLCVWFGLFLVFVCVVCVGMMVKEKTPQNNTRKKETSNNNNKLTNQRDTTKNKTCICCVFSGCLLFVCLFVCLFDCSLLFVWLAFLFGVGVCGWFVMMVNEKHHIRTRTE